MKIVIALFIVCATTLVSVEIERNAFISKVFFNAEMNSIKKNLLKTEKNIVMAESHIENVLEGSSSGIN
jgi:hypothetical protein